MTIIKLETNFLKLRYHDKPNMFDPLIGDRNDEESFLFYKFGMWRMVEYIMNLKYSAIIDVHIVIKRTIL